MPIFSGSQLVTSLDESVAGGQVALKIPSLHLASAISHAPNLFGSTKPLVVGAMPIDVIWPLISVPFNSVTFHVRKSFA